MSQLGKLLWSCRRGTVELDRFLSGYLQQRYGLASQEEQQTFQGLLRLEDSQLLDYFWGRETAPDPRMHELIQVIIKLTNLRA